MSLHASQYPANPRLVVALDFDSMADCEALVAKLSPQWCRLKIGKELFTLYGPQLVERLQKRGFDVFLDLKFHDIPATVAKAVTAAAGLGVWMLNVHVSGGQAMMHAAAEALANCDHKPLLIGVTVLTSMSGTELQALGVAAPMGQHVLNLATLACESGLDGVVCSALETQAIRAQLGHDFVLVTPGIRPIGAAANDQKRIVTPADAMRNGSSYLVVGRPITQAANPTEVCEAIVGSMSQISTS